MKFPYSFPLTRAFCLYMGQASLLAWETFASILAGRIRWRLVIRQIVEIGFGSQAVVIVTGIFTGAVFTAQIFFQFNALNMSTAVGPVVSVALFRELGPVLTGLMVAGRVGAAMSAEIGTMKVTEQIDALRALAVNPIDYLVVPRAVALMFSMPLLVGECIFFALSASYVVATRILNVNSVFFLHHMEAYTHGKDMVMALTKGFVFAVIVAIVGCQQGLTTRNGAVGVGRSTTDAVVISSLTILMVNFFLTMALNIVFPAGQARY
jgi:phospholipid/cholesterol/gamma-HCH transport system permease protein